MSILYRHFGEAMSSTLDFSDSALISLYNAESYGSRCSSNNGFEVGKRFLNLQINDWKDGLREGTLAKFELYADPSFPHWWLDSIFKNLYDGVTAHDLLRTTGFPRHTATRNCHGDDQSSLAECSGT